MATATKKWSFLSTLESFTGVPDADTVMTHDSGNGNPSGSLKTVTSTRNQYALNYWYLDTTWEGLGVPVGAIVTHVRLNGSYYYAGLTDWLTDQVEWVVEGPYEIRTTDDITTIATMWAGSGQILVPGTGWITVGAQSDQAVSATYEASNQAIRIRFTNEISLDNDANAIASLHADELEIVVTYTLDVSGAWEQDSARGYEDGTESGSSVKAAVNTGWVQDVDETFHIRLLIQETAGASPAETFDLKLQYRKNTGSWTDVTTSSSNVKAVATDNLTDGADTTQRIGVGSWVTDNNWVCEDGICPLTTDTFSSSEAEALFSVQIVGADVVDGDVVEFRVLEVDATLLDSYVGASIFEIEANIPVVDYFPMLPNPMANIMLRM